MLWSWPQAVKSYLLDALGRNNSNSTSERMKLEALHSFGNGGSGVSPAMAYDGRDREHTGESTDIDKFAPHLSTSERPVGPIWEPERWLPEIDDLFRAFEDIEPNRVLVSAATPISAY